MPDAAADVAAKLTDWLAVEGIEARVDIVDRAVGGLSQETWLGTVTLQGRETDVVVRLPTPASGVRAILNQRAALQSVAGRGVRAPQLLWFDDSAENSFASPFIVMERATGTVPVGWHAIEEPRRSALARQAIETLAALHSIDVAATLLGSHQPSPLMDLDGLDRLFGRLEPLPTIVRAAGWWLRLHAPPGEPATALVHGDYRMGNMVVHGDEITGVLDWEMAAPGDPLADLAWCFIAVWEPSLVDEAAMVALYESTCARPVDLERLHWHRCLAFYRLSYYALAGSRAFGAGRSDDFRLAALGLQLPVHLDRLAAAMAGDPVT